MSSPSGELLRFVGELRAAQVPVSVAETLDAMRAVAAAGLADRVRVREALAAALIKDEADRPSFDEVFARFFGAGAGAARDAGRPGAHHRLGAPTGGGRGEQGASAQSRPERARADAPPHGGAPPSASPPQEPQEPAAKAAGAKAPAASATAKSTARRLGVASRRTPPPAARTRRRRTTVSKPTRPASTHAARPCSATRGARPSRCTPTSNTKPHAMPWGRSRAASACAWAAGCTPRRGDGSISAGPFVPPCSMGARWPNCACARGGRDTPIFWSWPMFQVPCVIARH